jgi:AraC-like DNA-binding protein
MPRKDRTASQSLSLGDTTAFTPSAARPVRVRSRHLQADSHFEPHSHAWSQLACSASGVLQVSARVEASAAPEVTYIVPPSRAVWIPPGALHSVHVVEAADMRTLYIHHNSTPADWTSCRVIEVSALLRELIAALDTASDSTLLDSAQRSSHLSALVLGELHAASPHQLGVPMPSAHSADRRLRALCEALLQSPALHSTLAQWAASVGASERTAARLFQQELGMGFNQWRQQVVLAHALPQLARGLSVGAVAQASGYASESAFASMFKAAMGHSPRQFLRVK